MGEAFVRILALHPDVEISSRQETPFGVLLVGGARRCALDPTEQGALWHACGAAPRTNDLPAAPPDLLELVAQRVMGDGLADVCERNPSPLGRDQHLQLAYHLELKPAFYEVIDAREQTVQLLAELGVVFYEACDGRRTVPELHAIAQDRGYLLDVSDVAKQVAQLQGAGVISRGLAPRRDGNLRVRVKALVARVPGDFGFLISSDEAEILSRFRSTRAVQDLLVTQPSQADRQWVLALINKATALGLLQPAEPAEDDLSGEFDQDNPTEISYAPIDELGDFQIPGRGGAPVRPTPPPRAATMPMGRPSAPYAAPMPSSRSTPMPVAAMPASRSSPMPAQMMQSRSASMQAVQAPPSRSTPMPVANPMAMHGAPPARASSSMLASGTPMAIVATEPSGPVLRAPAPPSDPSAQARLASLAALSLDKGADTSVPTTQRSRSSGGGSKLPWVLLVLVVAGGGYYIHSLQKNGPVAAPVAGGTADPGGSAKPIPVASPGSVVLTAAAYIEPKSPIVLSATTSGRMLEVKVDAGDPVKKGQLVARVDDKGIKARLNGAQMRVASASRNLENVRRLYKAQAKTMLDVSAAEGELQVARSEIGVIRQDLEDTKITSPIDGTVLERLIQPGESITAGAGEASGVLKIADLSKLVAEANINEGELKLVFMGQQTDIVVESTQGEPYKGTVREIAQQADRARGTVLVKIDIATEPARPLKPGMAVQVRFKAREVPPAAPEVPAGSAAAAGSAGSAAPQQAPAK